MNLFAIKSPCDNVTRSRIGTKCADDFGVSFAKDYNRIPSKEEIANHIPGFREYHSNHRATLITRAVMAAQETIDNRGALLRQESEAKRKATWERKKEFAPYLQFFAKMGITVCIANGTVSLKGTIKAPDGRVADYADWDDIPNSDERINPNNLIEDIAAFLSNDPSHPDSSSNKSKPKTIRVRSAARKSA